MRGLAFPPADAANRETSYEEGTPISNVDDIPIDPALGGTPIDPALMMDDESVVEVPGDVRQVSFGRDASVRKMPNVLQLEEPSVEDRIRQYSQGPQGDPFAPQIVPPFFPIEEAASPPPPPPKPKRKRRVQRENKCGFCGGDDDKNKQGEPEVMTTCHECGRSGHPSCMELERIGDVIRTYPWKCIECKNCEVCQEKGDDERILFCDWCDRGWHMDCVNPPLEDPPDGDWRCPMCPELSEDGGHEYEVSEHPQQSSVPSMREGSIASTSRSVPEVTPAPVSKARRGKKAPAKRKRAIPVPVPASDGSDNDDLMDIVETPIVNSRRARASRPSAKVKASTASSDEEPQSRSARAPKRKRPRDSSPPQQLSRVRLRVTAPRGGKGKEREVEEDEPPHGLFDDILGLQERDVTKTTPVQIDKVAFERSRILAEEKLAQAMHPPPPPPVASSSRSDRHSSSTNFDSHLSARPLRSAVLQQISASTPRTFDFSNSPGPSTPGGSALPKFEPGVLRIRSIRFGPYEIKTWYDAPFPEEYATIPDGRLWICEFCLKYMKSRFKAIRHQMKCKARHPPGDEIYRDGDVSIFEVDGRRNKIYCQNLCLLSKMFLDHKSLFYDVEPFLFYVIAQVDENGARFVGYFSKEKRCPKEYNLSCIMTLPVRQRQGWGNLLIDFSYLLSKIEQRVGSPEKPLSSLGALGYRNYWTLAVMRFLETAPDNVRLEDISSATSMTIEDVCDTLTQQNMIVIREATPPLVRPSPGQSIKYPKGRKHTPASGARRSLARAASSLYGSPSPQKAGANGVNGHGPKQPANPHGHGAAERQGPFVPPTRYEIHFDREKAAAYMRAWESKNYKQLRPERLQWTPYLVARATAEGAYGYVGVEGGRQMAEAAAATEDKHLPAQDTMLLGDVAKELAIRSGELLEGEDDILSGLASLGEVATTTRRKKKGGRGRRALVHDEPTPASPTPLAHEPPEPNGTAGHMEIDSPTGVGAKAQPHAHAGTPDPDAEDEDEEHGHEHEMPALDETPSRQRGRGKRRASAAAKQSPSASPTTRRGALGRFARAFDAPVDGPADDIPAPASRVSKGKKGRSSRRTAVASSPPETDADAEAPGEELEGEQNVEEEETAKELLEDDADAEAELDTDPSAEISEMQLGDDAVAMAVEPSVDVAMSSPSKKLVPVLMVTLAPEDIKAEFSASPALPSAFVSESPPISIPIPHNYTHTPTSNPNATSSSPYNTDANNTTTTTPAHYLAPASPSPPSSLPAASSASPSRRTHRSPIQTQSPTPTLHLTPSALPTPTHLSPTPAHLTPASTPPPISASTHLSPTPTPTPPAGPSTPSDAPPAASPSSTGTGPTEPQTAVAIKRPRGRPRRKPLDPDAPSPATPPPPPPPPVPMELLVQPRSLRSSKSGSATTHVNGNGNTPSGGMVKGGGSVRSSGRGRGNMNADVNAGGSGASGGGTGTGAADARGARLQARNGTRGVNGHGMPVKGTTLFPEAAAAVGRRGRSSRHAPADVEANGDAEADAEADVEDADADMDDDDEGQVNGHGEGRTLSSRTSRTSVSSGSGEPFHKRPAPGPQTTGSRSKRRRIESSPEMDEVVSEKAPAATVSVPVLPELELEPEPEPERQPEPAVVVEAVLPGSRVGVVHGFAESYLRSTLEEDSASGEEDAEGEEDEEYLLHVNQ